MAVGNPLRRRGDLFDRVGDLGADKVGGRNAQNQHHAAQQQQQLRQPRDFFEHLAALRRQHHNPWAARDGRVARDFIDAFKIILAAARAAFLNHPGGERAQRVQGRIRLRLFRNIVLRQHHLPVLMPHNGALMVDDIAVARVFVGDAPADIAEHQAVLAAVKHADNAVMHADGRRKDDDRLAIQLAEHQVGAGQLPRLGFLEKFPVGNIVILISAVQKRCLPGQIGIGKQHIAHSFSLGLVICRFFSHRNRPVGYHTVLGQCVDIAHFRFDLGCDAPGVRLRQRFEAVPGILQQIFAFKGDGGNAQRRNNDQYNQREHEN